ncbi:MAG: DNA-binding protein [Propionibacterium sp.]|nr:MAG: DNA-binding protein [Propionibacterium sp.]
MLPIRTCVGCRKTAEKNQLIRIVALAGEAVIDLRQDRVGRGAYLHNDVSCLKQANRKRALSRALRTTVNCEGLVLPCQQTK